MPGIRGGKDDGDGLPEPKPKTPPAEKPRVRAVVRRPQVRARVTDRIS